MQADSCMHGMVGTYMYIHLQLELQCSVQWVLSCTVVNVDVLVRRDAALGDVSVGSTCKEHNVSRCRAFGDNRLMGPNLFGGVRGPHADGNEGACYRPISGRVS